jgi:S1-C subfamily serine protease
MVVPADESWKWLLPVGAVLLLVMALVGGDDQLEWPWLVGWFLAAALIAGGVAGWLRGRKQAALLGAPAGTYLFASDLIDFRDGVCTVFDLDQLTEIRPKVVHDAIPSSEIEFVFGHNTLAIRLMGKQAAQLTINKFWPARESLLAAVSAEEWDTVASFDPLYEARYMGTWDQLRRPSAVMLTRHSAIDGKMGGGLLGIPAAVWKWGAIAGAVIAPILWWSGNFLRESMAFSRAQSHDSVASWSAYLKRSQPRHYSEVKEQYLPKAALRAAKKDGTAAALRGFLTRYGQTSSAPEAQAALHALFADAAAKAQAEAGEPAREALKNLLKWMEDHQTSQLEVRFGSSSAAQMAAIDEFIQEIGMARRVKVPIAPIGPSLAPRVVNQHEDELVDLVKAGFGTYLRPDVVEITKGGVFSGMVAALDQPALTVTCYAEPRPVLIPDEDTRQLFLGLAFNVEFNLYVPGSTPYTSKFEVAFADQAPKTRGKDTLYDGMVTYAFEETGSRIADALFPKYHPERHMTLMNLTPLGPGSGAAPPGGGPISSATGFCISPDGYIVTARHFTDSAASFKVVTKEGAFEARLIVSDPQNDLSVLKVAHTFPSALALRPSESVKLGESIATIGFPQTQVQGREPKIGKGEIASLSGMQDNPTMFQVSVPLQPGNSGGPLLDLRGNVVGVVVIVLRQAQVVNYAVKSTRLLNLVGKIPEIHGLATVKEGAAPAFEDMIENVRPATVLIEGYP